MNETPKQLHVQAADMFYEAEQKSPHTVLGVASFGLSLVEDVRAGRVRNVQAFQSFNKRATPLIPTLSDQERLFLVGVTNMVINAFENGAK